MAGNKETKRSFLGLYILAALELIFGVLLIIAAVSYAPQLFRQAHTKIPPDLDDYLALVGMAVPGAAVTVAGAMALLHKRLPASLPQRFQIVAIAADIVMVLVGAGMWAVVRHRGGDWTGLGLLASLLFVAGGGLLFFISFFCFLSLRRPKSIAA